MINIFYSASLRATSNVQDALNDLATLWTWKKIVYDEDVTTNVKELWLSDKIYITCANFEQNTQFKFVHAINGYSYTVSSISMSQYEIIVTDAALIFATTKASAAYPIMQYFAIGKTIDDNDVESHGLIFVSGSMCYCFVDNMTKVDPINVQTSTGQTSSVVNTQLIPVYSYTSGEHFTDVYLTYMRRSTDAGEVKLYDKYYYKYYYIRYNLAIAYTP